MSAETQYQLFLILTVVFIEWLKTRKLWRHFWATLWHSLSIDFSLKLFVDFNMMNQKKTLSFYSDENRRAVTTVAASRPLRISSQNNRQTQEYTISHCLHVSDTRIIDLRMVIRGVHIFFNFSPFFSLWLLLLFTVVAGCYCFLTQQWHLRHGAMKGHTWNQLKVFLHYRWPPTCIFGPRLKAKDYRMRPSLGGVLSSKGLHIAAVCHQVSSAWPL